MAELNKIVEEIKKLTIVEVADLVKKLEEEFGVSAAAAVAAAPAGGAVDGAPAAAEKSSFNITLKDAGANKIAVIKLVKEITGLGLGEAKALVDGAPSKIKEGVKTEEAKEFEVKFKEAGATIELS
ncbi:MAG: 50S ribosomal protein L7/L12 [Christensenellaceae bacterium]|nr:50S ribosomal protein L7/L12 [Christensenellaceae bacterium]